MNDDDLNIINPDVAPQQIKEFKKDLAHYRKTLAYMGANVPIQVLCLPKALENSLKRAGLVRVYDLISRDLTEIEGVGKSRLELLAARLDEFFTMSI